MAEINVSVDIKKAKKSLTRLQRKQIPFAAAGAINDLLFEARRAEQNAQRNYIDRPVRFTQTGFLIKKANKHTMAGSIEVPPNRWKYIKHLVKGGTSTRAGKSHAIPINPGLLNKFGGLPRNKSATLLRRKDHFSATIGGIAGVWKREKSGALTLQILFKPSTTHNASYPLWKATRRLVSAKFKHKFNRRLEYALRTAR